MKDGGKDVPRGLLKYSPDSNNGAFTNVPPLKWGKPNFQPLPDNSGKDQFGNRMHYSADLAYLDRNEKVARAGLLLSPDGQALVRDMPGCLTQLDRAIGLIHKTKQTKAAFASGTLARTSMFGAQSKVYIWTVPSGEKYIIKVPTENPRDVKQSERIDQPYIDEMLQTQEIQTKFKSLSEETGVRMSSFLFASSSVSCTKLEEGNHPDSWTTDQLTRITTFAKSVRKHIADRRFSEDGLFLRVGADIDSNGAPSPNNVIIGADGTMTWIDPFVT